MVKCILHILAWKAFHNHLAITNHDLVNKVDKKLILTAGHFTLTPILLQISYQKVFALGSINSSKMHQTKTVGSKCNFLMRYSVRVSQPNIDWWNLGIKFSFIFENETSVNEMDAFKTYKQKRFKNPHEWCYLKKS